MSALALPPMLTVDMIAERYGLRDARAARALIRDAGGKKFAGRWMVRADLLDAFERTSLDATGSLDQSISHAQLRRPLPPLAPGELLT